MKKIVSIVLLMVAFGFSANAQSNLKLESDAKSKKENTNVKEMAHTDVRELSNIIKLTPEMKNSFIDLLIMRGEALMNSKDEDEKKAITDKYGKKLLSALSDEQLKKLSENKELYYKLTGLKVN